MKPLPRFLRVAIPLALLVGLAAGCEDVSPGPSPQTVVKKKIDAPADRTAPAPRVTPPVAQAPAPAPPSAVPAPPAPRPPQPPQPLPPTKILGPPEAQAALPPSPPAPAPAAEQAVSDAQVAALLNIPQREPYDPKGKPDPFEPVIRDEGTAAGPSIRPKKRLPQTPLERVDLGQLKLVAIVAAPTGNRAMVEEASGKGYILREGTFIGLNSGRVVEIQADKVLIEEEYEDVYGKSLVQKKELKLPKPPGEL